jgi:glutamate synthase (ferredoxin)
MVFYQKKENQVEFCKTTFETAIRNQNLNIIGWRDVPVDVSNWTNSSRKRTNSKTNVYWQEWFEPTEQQRQLFAARKIAEHTILNSKISESHMFYFSSLYYYYNI